MKRQRLLLILSLSAVVIVIALVIILQNSAERRGLGDDNAAPAEINAAEPDVPPASRPPQESSSPAAAETPSPVIAAAPQTAEPSADISSIIEQPDSADDSNAGSAPDSTPEPTGGSATEPAEAAISSTPPPEAPSIPEEVSPAPADPPAQTPAPAPPAEPAVVSTSEYEKRYGWSFARAGRGVRPNHYAKCDFEQYGGYYLGKAGNNTVYLTFDQGYENGYTSIILDTLRDKGVNATFFLTAHYLNSSGPLVIRMAEEGHAIGSHSVRHLSSPSLSEDELIYEIEEPLRMYTALTGKEAIKHFRPPMGDYSEKSLAITNKIGYRTAFWSFAYYDWVTDDQPLPERAFEIIINGTHDGAVLLLHSVSRTNAEVLGDVIDWLLGAGYVFKTLEDFE